MMPHINENPGDKVFVMLARCQATNLLGTATYGFVFLQTKTLAIIMGGVPAPGIPAYERIDLSGRDRWQAVPAGRYTDQ